MKFCNKQKKYRLTEWAVSPAPKIYLVKEAKKWCQDHISHNKFYFHYTNTRWWFENKDDALHFALVWSNHAGI
jgi:hypothetical protein